MRVNEFVCGFREFFLIFFLFHKGNQSREKIEKPIVKLWSVSFIACKMCVLSQFELVDSHFISFCRFDSFLFVIRHSSFSIFFLPFGLRDIFTRIQIDDFFLCFPLLILEGLCNYNKIACQFFVVIFFFLFGWLTFFPLTLRTWACFV